MRWGNGGGVQPLPTGRDSREEREEEGRFLPLLGNSLDLIGGPDRLSFTCLHLPEETVHHADTARAREVGVREVEVEVVAGREEGRGGVSLLRQVATGDCCCFFILSSPDLLFATSSYCLAPAP